MSVPNEAARPAAVYRLYDDAGALLYVGSAYDPAKRYETHRCKPWWTEVARRVEEWHPSRAAAFTAEEKAIKLEQPTCNTAWTPRQSESVRSAHAQWNARVLMAEDEGGPDMVSFRELARRLVTENVVEKISHQRVSQLHRDDPDFPPVTKIGRSLAVDWRAARPYFQNRKSRQGQRTDLRGRQGATEE